MANGETFRRRGRPRKRTSLDDDRGPFSGRRDQEEELFEEEFLGEEEAAVAKQREESPHKGSKKDKQQRGKRKRDGKRTAATGSTPNGGCVGGARSRAVGGAHAAS
eukprot:5778399-Pleurochrysis_carterae.AAC.1